jgi:hypothetical protein
MNSVDFFTTFAHETNKKINFSEHSNPQFYRNQIPLTKRTISIPYNDHNEVFLLCYNDPKSFAKHPFYCGVFFSSSVSIDFEMAIKKRFFIDKINPFNLQKNRLKTHTPFDSEVIIEGGTDADLSWLMNSELQEIFSELFTIDQRMIIGYNQTRPDFEESLIGKPTFGIFIDDWIFDQEIIEKLFKMALIIKKKIK